MKKIKQLIFGIILLVVLVAIILFVVEKIDQYERGAEIFCTCNGEDYNSYTLYEDYDVVHCTDGEHIGDFSTITKKGSVKDVNIRFFFEDNYEVGYTCFGFDDGTEQFVCGINDDYKFDSCLYETIIR